MLVVRFLKPFVFFVLLVGGVVHDDELIVGYADRGCCCSKDLGVVVTSVESGFIRDWIDMGFPNFGIDVAIGSSDGTNNPECGNDLAVSTLTLLCCCLTTTRRVIGALCRKTDPKIATAPKTQSRSKDQNKEKDNSK